MLTVAALVTFLLISCADPPTVENGGLRVVETTYEMLRFTIDPGSGQRVYYHVLDTEWFEKVGIDSNSLSLVWLNKDGRRQLLRVLTPEDFVRHGRTAPQ